MNGRGFPWLLAAIPATAFGHGLAYALAGREQADAHHSYLVPAFLYSAALLLAFCAARLLRALSRPRRLSSAAPSLAATAAKLSIVKVALFALAERVEGFAPAPSAYAIQILVALFVAIAIVYFAQLVRRCERSAIEAGDYLRRVLALTAGLRFNHVSRAPAYALAVSAGPARFPRPPPYL